MGWEVGWLADDGRRGGERSIFFEQIKTSPPKQACHQNLTFFFHPLADVDERERLRGSDGVKDGRGASGERCHDGMGGK